MRLVNSITPEQWEELASYANMEPNQVVSVFIILMMDVRRKKGVSTI
ncbi:hypothetical protein SPD48_11190 [Pseudogracilibacillus sp. SE30717A]